ncbi:MAG: cell division protein ZapA [Hyphomicrobiaceae bacterium]
MGQVTISLNGRSYRLLCGDGEEQRLDELASFLRTKVDHLADQTGHHGDDRLLVMAALLIADEFLELKARPAVEPREDDREDDAVDGPVVDDVPGAAPNPPPIPKLVHDADASVAEIDGGDEEPDPIPAGKSEGDVITVRRLRTLVPAPKSLEVRLAEARSGRSNEADRPARSDPDPETA